MKFNKVLIGLMAVVPFALTSCTRAMSRDATLSWIKNHYKIDTSETLPALALTEWNYRNIKGTRAFDIVEKQIIDDIVNEEHIEGLSSLIPDLHGPLSGHEYRIGVDTKIVPLNETTFNATTFSTDSKDDVFKIKDDSLNVTYKRKYEYEKDAKGNPKYVTTTNVRNYNKKGYCTDYGCKVDGKWIDKDNSIKFKITLHFIYADDPVD